MTRLLAAIIGAVTLSWLNAVAAQAETAEPDKSGYHLFSPVPRERMRELSTDRPDTTESPYTVDAGHFQAEIDLVVFAYDREPGHELTDLAFASANLKAGILNWMDLQLVVEPYHRAELKLEPDGESVVDDGYGATTLRLKMNLWGNDEGSTALALMPFVSHDHGATDFGLIVPFGGELPGGFGYGLMLEGDVVTRENDERGFELVGTATIGHDIVGPLGAYFELAGTIPTYDTGASTLALDAGLTLGLLDDLQLDLGARIGAAGPIDDIQAFLGISFRI